MVAARLAKFRFKTGKREEGFEELDLILNKKVRSAKGYRGYLSFFSCDQDDVTMILTIWADDESFLNSEELFASAVDKVKHLLETQPDVEHYRVDTVNIT